MARTVLAFDLGASSGRAMLVRLEQEKLQLQEVHRFDNIPVKLQGTLYWDFPLIMREIYTGLQKAYAAEPYESIAIDTWGVDFGLLDKQGHLLENPVHYRDVRTNSSPEWVFRRIVKERLYAITGIQHMQINTVFQLASLAQDRPDLLSSAEVMLPMPNLIAYYLTGQKQAEYTIASTMELLPAGKAEWSEEILSSLGLPQSLFPPLALPGTPCGMLSDNLCQALTIPPVMVVNTACHDTASAVAAVPASGENDFVYLSCGTWSLMGTETRTPILSEESCRSNFTNEGGVNGTIRYLKNIMGLWILQECRRQWAEKEPVPYSQLVKEAEASPPFACFIDPDDPRFAAPGDMVKRIQAYLGETGQPLPPSRGGLVRCIYESLALRYRQTMDTLGCLTGKTYPVLHAVGGGIQAEIQMQMAANAMHVPVIAGPIEATALGNALIQLVALGAVKNIDQGRQFIAASFAPKVYKPQEDNAWEDAYRRFLAVTKR